MVYKYSSWGLANKHNWGTTLYHWDHPGDLKIGEANQKNETNWLVVDLPLCKIWKSVGVTIPNIWKKHKFQTTNQKNYDCNSSIIFSIWCRSPVVVSTSTELQLGLSISGEWFWFNSKIFNSHYTQGFLRIMSVAELPSGKLT